MAFDGVFAFQGKDHITASQLGRIVEGVAGKGRYVLPTLNQMTAEMQTANKVRVGTGDLVMDGRVVTNEAAVDLTVESGTSGYKRNDLVVCRYTKNASTGVEKFAAEVVKGTPTTGTAADPKVTEGDISTGSASAVMPLWRIPLNGITPGAPVRIAPVASTLKTLGDSVSRSRNALILSEDVGVSGYKGVISVRHDGFGTVAERYDEAGFVVDEETFVQVSGILWTDNEAGTAWPALVKAPWQPDDLKDYWCAKMPVEVAKKGAGSVAHRAHFDKDCALYISAAANGSIAYSGVTTKRLFTSTDGYIYIALHKAKPDAVPAIIYVDTTVPLSSL
nr:MAG TPA: hypothetical protein [Caudoviricetes sp.]